MVRPSLLLTLLFLASRFGLTQAVSPITQAERHGLNGPDHTVLTEEFEYVPDLKGQVVDSIIRTYDPQGNLVEESRYEADGTLHSSLKITRDSWQVLNIEKTSVVPEENQTVIRSYDSDGAMKQNDIYDQEGVTRTTFELLPKASRSNGGYRSRQVNPEGKVVLSVSAESTDPATGVTRITTTVDGKPTASGMIRPDAAGTRELSVQASPDGSFYQMERKPDGTVSQHTYSASTKTHDYLTMDQQRRLVEAVLESPSDYYKTTFRYDGLGRQIEMACYDRTGRLLSKNTTEYRNDDHENWIEQKESQWQAASSSGPAHTTFVSMQTRMITYY
jgi:hypothetical protein